jgi:DNA replicative helicase MCM subunit Mcm2 (Cdc46/Mcm family)
MRDSLIEYIDYYKEGDRVVFTALFHSKRGFCCGNLCRHCPYKPKHIKYNTEMDLNELENLKKQAEALELNENGLSEAEKMNEALKIFEQLNVLLKDLEANDQETEQE